VSRRAAENVELTAADRGGARSATASSGIGEQLHRALAASGNTVIQVTESGDPLLDFAHSVAEGLSCEPRRLECRFLYDARGSRLYEKICEQEEYYPTRTEAAILANCSGEIRSLVGPASLMELGSGSSVKTGYLLDAFAEGRSGVCYVPVDVSASALDGAAVAITSGRPGVRVVGINGVYEEALPLLPVLSPALLVFLGSTIGNLDEAEAAAFWKLVARSLGPADHMLLGIDLVKDPAILEAAYDDAAGVTRRFTKNYFVRMNRELGAGLDLDAIEHEARYDREQERIEIHARFTREQAVQVRPLGLTFQVAAGERVLVEISRKFRIERMRRELARFGLATVRTFTDDRRWFALLLLRKAGNGKA